MITKTKPSHNQSVVYYTRYPSGDEYRTNVQVGASTISYREGPPRLEGRCNWKECYHTKINSREAAGGWTWLAVPYVGGADGFINWCPNELTSGNWSLPPAGQNLYGECAENLRQKLDLNTSDAVLVYSGVLQAVPLLGGALKFTSIMNKAARNLSKSFKRKPFTTVVKSLISADFIDRFVVKPTIDDARKFADATNYVLRVLNTMHERNMMPVRYEAEASDYKVSNRGDYWRSIPISNSRIYGDRYLYGWSYDQTYIKSKVFMLAQVAYQTDAVSPIKLWAQRVGLTRPLDSVWDLVPFSFVIDYFTRAGDFISGLSDEMSSQEGLKGKIQSISGMWATTSLGNEHVIELDHGGNLYFQNGYVGTNVFTKGFIRRGSYRFERVPINPWLYQPFPDSSLVDVKLTSSRAKTLLELLVQAKA